ncbi:nuclear protein MDM1-like isoform X2 [Limulus polyphemus]|uniref:Nuclear protein MDM1 n=1 Tax=Limulus polyphemus TaxID=6850 RepID=A0ABM1SVX6_LIMPO|nr:nuclear protein MDM1-like isoform X2 [Limulus polyphemus]
MLNTVCNLCRACPMPTDEKESYTEYKRSFTWRPNPDEVVQKPPESVKTMEPALYRKKKYHDLTYKRDLLLNNEEVMDYSDSKSTGVGIDTHSSERKSRTLKRQVNGISNPHKEYVKQPHVDVEPVYPTFIPYGNPNLVEDTTVVPKVTEYRSNFAWPLDGSPLSGTHKESYGSDQSTSKTTEDSSSESPEIFRNQNEDEKLSPRTIMGKKTEYKSKFQPFSAYVYVDGSWKKTEKLRDVEGKPLDEANPWYSEVVERIKKAGEYRVRSQGRPFYGDQSTMITRKSVEDESLLPTYVLIATSRPSARSASSEQRKEKTPEAKHEVSPRRQPKVMREGHTSKLSRPASVPRFETSEKGSAVTTPPGAKSRPVPRRPPSSIVNGQEPKVLPKPTTTESTKMEVTNGEQLEKDRDEKDAAKELVQSEHKKIEKFSPQDAVRPNSLQAVNGDLESKSPSPIPEPPTGPVPLTTVKSPEEVTGIKSPDPETWTIPLETSKDLEWTDGHIPVDGKRSKYPSDFIVKAEVFPENGELIESGV